MTRMAHVEGQQQNKKPEMKKGVTSVVGINNFYMRTYTYELKLLI